MFNIYTICSKFCPFFLNIEALFDDFVANKGLIIESWIFLSVKEGGSRPESLLPFVA